MNNDKSSNRNLSIDALKAMAILSVITMHTFQTSVLQRLCWEFYIQMAVPIFIILMGYNGYRSFQRRSKSTLSQIFNKDYFKKNFYRSLMPYLISYALSILIIITRLFLYHTNDFYKGFAALPWNGPGDYYIFILLQFIIIFPFIYVAFLKHPLLTLISSYIINFGFELLSPHIPIFSSNPMLYSSCILRYLFLLPLGIYIAKNPHLKGKKNIPIYIGSILSFMYIFASHFYGYVFPYFNPTWGDLNILCFFYAGLLVVLALNFIPSKGEGLISRCLSFIGERTYEIFLMQILFFPFKLFAYKGLYINVYSHKFSLLLSFSLNLICCIGLGSALSLLCKSILKGTPKQRALH